MYRIVDKNGRGFWCDGASSQRSRRALCSKAVGLALLQGLGVLGQSAARRERSDMRCRYPNPTGRLSQIYAFK
jgi:hypothetical protein